MPLGMKSTGTCGNINNLSYNRLLAIIHLLHPRFHLCDIQIEFVKVYWYGSVVKACEFSLLIYIFFYRLKTLRLKTKSTAFLLMTVMF